MLFCLMISDGRTVTVEFYIGELAPNRSISYLLAPVAIISMAQQASPNVMGQILDCCPQFMASSTVVVMTFSSNRPSIHVISDTSLIYRSNRVAV